MRNYRPRTNEVPTKIGIDDSIPKLFRRLRNRTDRINTRIVHEDVDATETLQNLNLELFDGVDFGYIRLTCKRWSPRFFNFCGNGLRLLLVNIGDYNARPLASKTKTDRAPDTLAGSSYNRDLIFQLHGITNPPLT